MSRRLTVTEAVAITGVDRARIMTAIETGALVAYNAAKEGASRAAWRITPDNLRAWQNAGSPISK